MVVVVVVAVDDGFGDNCFAVDATYSVVATALAVPYHSYQRIRLDQSAYLT